MNRGAVKLTEGLDCGWRIAVQIGGIDRAAVSSLDEGPKQRGCTASAARAAADSGKGRGAGCHPPELAMRRSGWRRSREAGSAGGDIFPH
jgi:hypothetical protein